MNVFLRSQFNYDTAAASDETALTCPEPSMAIQSARDDCDINTIVRRFGLTGELPTALAAPTYDDFSEVTDFHSALNAIALANEAFDQLPAETIAQWFRKGSPILITGRLKQETWDDKQTGQKRYKVKIVLSQFDFCGDTKGSGGGVQQPAGDDQSGRSAHYGQPHSTPANSAPVAGDEPPESDDVPF